MIVAPTEPAPDSSSRTALNYAEIIRDKVLGCWLGKSIGGTLGAPDEGKQYVLNVTDYPPLHGEALPNDDLDLQLVWLSVLERHGLATDAHTLSRAWLDHVHFPYGEYGYAIRNLRRGLLPPVSGMFDNPFTNGMGSPIRTEIWAIAGMGNPYLAATLAYEDAIVDHAGESIWGSIFCAALESAAFGESDPDTLLDMALGLIPPTSRVHQAIQGVRADHRAGRDWLEARERVLAHYGNLEDFTDAPQNIAFAIIGWLYGADFSDAVLKTVNCGFDTDSSGAMLGALLGILHGAKRLPERWTRPLGERVVVSPGVGGFDFPQTLAALTSRSLEVTRLLQLQLSADTTLARVMRERATLSGVHALWQGSHRTVTWRATQTRATACGLEVSVTYLNGPSLAPHETLELEVRLHNCSSWPWTGKLRLKTPEGWDADGDSPVELLAGGSRQFAVTLRQTEVRGQQFEDRAQPEEALIAHLELEQTLSGVVWQRQSYPVAFAASREWRVTADDGLEQAHWLAGGGLEFASGVTEATQITARTTVLMVQATPVRVVVMGKTPIQISLNNAALFSIDGLAAFFPSPHITRHEGFENCYHDITLPAGQHEFELRYPARRPDGQPNHPDFRIASLLEPQYHHIVELHRD